jgi:hypothetical protein
VRISLPSIKEFAPKMSKSFYTLIYKYFGSASGDTFEIQTAFKVNNDYSYLIAPYELNGCIMLISGRNCSGDTSHMIDTEPLRVLLTYAERILTDSTQQSLVFGVLKAVIKRKLTSEELPDASELFRSDGLPVG